MKIKKNGISLWYGTEDAPAPRGMVSVDKPIEIMVAVKPADLTNQVFIFFMVNDQPQEPVAASFYRNNQLGNVQYFRAELPPLKAGDQVYYGALCHSRGLQVPRAGDEVELPMLIQGAMPQEIKQNGSQARILHPQPPQPKAESGAPYLQNGNLSLEPVNKPVVTSPNVNMHERKLARADILKKTLPSETHGLFDQHYIEQGGKWTLCSKCLKKEPELDKPARKRLRFTHQLAKLSGDNEPLIAVFYQTTPKLRLREVARQFSRHKILEEIRKTGVPASAKGKDEERRLHRYADKVANRLYQARPGAVVHRMLHDSELSAEDHNTRQGAARVLDNFPAFDFRRQSVYLLFDHPDAFAGVPDEHRPQVQAYLKVLQHLIPVSPNERVLAGLIGSGFGTAHDIYEIPASNFIRDYAPALGGKKYARAVHDQAQRVCQHQEHKWFTMRDLAVGPSPLMAGGGKSPEERKEMILKYAHEPHTRPKKGKKKKQKPPPDPAGNKTEPTPPQLKAHGVARQSGHNAEGRPHPEHKGPPAAKGLANRDHGGPHSPAHPPASRRSAKPAKPRIRHGKKAKMPINWEALFGSEDHCEVKHADSILGGAAYLGEVCNFLRNNNLDPDEKGALKIRKKSGDIKNTALEKLFARRPDLADLKLTAENTETTLPYVDLVNEILESYLVYLEKKKRHPGLHKHIPAHNVRGESDAQLLSEPRHTNYDAYRILKKMVYPANLLPYNEPVDAVRHYLEYLGTSRHELLDTFRKKIKARNPRKTTRRRDIVDKYAEIYEKTGRERAVDAEYLNLTEEEYIILTKNAFQHKNLHLLRNPVHPVRGSDEGHQEPSHQPAGQPVPAHEHRLIPKGKKRRKLRPAHRPAGHKKQYRKDIKSNPVYALYGFENKGDMRRHLKWIKPDPESGHGDGTGFLARTGLTYKELEELLQTRFVNPNIPGGEALVMYNQVKAVYRNLETMVDHAAADHKGKHTQVILFLREHLRQSVHDIECWVNQYFPRIARIIVIGGDDLGDSCDLGKMRLQHLDGSDLKDTEYGNINRFLRLWRKTGWRMDELDQAITGVGKSPRKKQPAAAKPAERHALTAPRLTKKGKMKRRRRGQEPRPDPHCPQNLCPDCDPLPVLHNPYRIKPATIKRLAALKRLQALTGQDLNKLLLLWQDFNPSAEHSLYRRLFLDYNILGIDKVFAEDKYGNHLAKVTPISKHLPVLMAAFQVSSEQLRIVLRYTGLSKAQLTLHHLSVVYRHILLAKTLHIRIEDLPETLELLAPLADPFKNPTTAVRFLSNYNRVVESGFKPSTLNYIVRGKDNRKRPFKPTPKTVLNLAVSIQNALKAIDVAHPDLTDDAQATDELVRSKLGLFFNQQTSARILSLLNGTFVSTDTTRRQITKKLDPVLAKSIEQYFKQLKDPKKNPVNETTQNGAQPAASEDPARFRNFGERVQFREAAGLQVTGILGEEDIALFDSIPGIAEYGVAIKKILTQPEIFLEQTLGTVLGENMNAAREILLMPDLPARAADENGNGVFPGTAQIKRAWFLNMFLPYLRDQLSRREVAQLISSAVRLELDNANLLLHTVLTSRSGKTAYQSITELREMDAETEENQGHWQGFICPQRSGVYRFMLEVENFSSELTRNAEFRINGKPLWSGPLSDMPDDEGLIYYQSNRIRLKAGEVYPIELSDFDRVPGTGQITGFSWKSGARPQEAVPASALFRAVETKKFRKIYVRLQKAAMLVNEFNLNTRELEFLHENRADFTYLNFRALSLKQWFRLEGYTRLRNQLPAGPDSLLEFLRWARDPEREKEMPHGLDPGKQIFKSLAGRIGKLINRNSREIRRLLAARFFPFNVLFYFRDEKNLLKILETLKVADKIGIDIGKLYKWGDSGTGFGRNLKTARQIKAALRARYSRKEWEQAIKPVHDKLREHRKQALVGSMLVQPELRKWGVIDKNSLYEFFLIDTEMDPCMDTSRIVQAIASAQLFVQRCMLGLEKGIPANLLDRERWAWMNRYRVWEANRKVFLYPENWIDPVLRDDKSPFFKELESELMQNDISEENVKNALISYLHKVDEVADLQVVGLYQEGTRKNGKLHIFGRTRNAPYFYYYRYYDAAEKNWRPWEKMEVDITSYDVEDEHGRVLRNGCYLIPVVWNKRLMIFFPQFNRKTIESQTNKGKKIKDLADEKIEHAKPIEYWEIKMAFSEYKKGKWTQKVLSSIPVHSIWEGRDKNPLNFAFLSEIEGFAHPHYRVKVKKLRSLKK
ncbi:MAG TPA: neuraminidase-like domain-containing protein, partial [Flavilitoribacter sp.]|nr:neuraminidase-like domain-containing protein [Flavilitoribacter sp.]HMQ87128.1 neuraminidase-like domain-containing protein [Flavilitoribacter sp.]